MDDENLPERTVTCTTPDCTQLGTPKTLPCADVVYCGSCGQQITDIT